MPNWCYNSLTVEGDENELKKFDYDFINYNNHNSILFYNKLRYAYVLLQWCKKYEDDKEIDYEMFCKYNMFFIKYLIYKNCDDIDVRLNNLINTTFQMVIDKNIKHKKIFIDEVKWFENYIKPYYEKFEKIIIVNKYEDKYDFINIPTNNLLKYRNERHWFNDVIGTYSIPFEIQCQKSKNTLSYTFETRWSPCDNWIKDIIKIYKNLEFSYYYDECGAMIAGEINGKDGIVEYEFDFIRDTDGSNIEYEKYVNEIETDEELLNYLKNEQELDYDTVIEYYSDGIKKSLIDKVYGKIREVKIIKLE